MTPSEHSKQRGREGDHQYEEIARAMSKWSSCKPWETRHPNNQRHWLFVAEAVMSNADAITKPTLVYVRARKNGATPAEARAMVGELPASLRDVEEGRDADRLREGP